jgi:hypothetical protein
MAIITNRIKKQVIESLITDFDSTGTQYYIGVGRSQDWNDSDVAPTELSHQREERDFRHGLQSIKTIADLSFVVPRYNWSSGAVYSAYRDNFVGYPTQPYYVINENNQVYICIENATNAEGVAIVSTVQPTGNTSGTPFATADGYIWKFLYSVSAIDANKFIAANYIPVKLQGLTDSNSQASDIEQLAVQNAAVPGQIIGYTVESGGAGYTSAPTLSVTGNGSEAQATLSISGGVVTKAELIDSSGAFTLGSGYDYAKVTLSGGGTPSKPAKLRPVLSTPLGFGGDPRDDLRSTAIMFNVKPEGAEGNGDWIIGNDFRQIGLVKNMRAYVDGKADSANGPLFSATTGSALNKLGITGLSGDQVDVRFTQSATGASAYIDKIDSANIWYHQDEDTGFTEFNLSAITGTGISGTVNSVDSAEVYKYTGEVLYIDNRAAVSRSADQTEDIKIVIQI